MGVWLNEDEIDRAKEILERVQSPVAPFARFLADWRDIVNRSSDGWPYWKGGTRPAARLSELVQKAMNMERGLDRGGEVPTDRELRAALVPIRAAATRHKLACPELKVEAAGPRP